MAVGPNLANYELMTRKPRNRFAQPFLIGALSSTFLGGCISQTTSGAEDDGGTGGRSSTCPTSRPAPGTSCDDFEENLTCYPETKCGPSGVHCGKDGLWREVFRSCNPPPPLVTECPEELPGAGTSCSGYQKNLRCEDPYKSCPPMPPYTIACGEDGTWEVVHGPVKCNPPPPPITECPNPKELPKGGTSCAAYQPGLKCEYPAQSCSPYPPLTIACGDDGNWEVIHPPVECNPPSPMGGAGGESPQ